MARKDIKFDDIIKSVFERNGNMNNIRFVAVNGTGQLYAKCGKSEPKETILKKLIGQDLDGCSAIRFIPIELNNCNSAVMCGQRVRSTDELVLGSIEMADDGLPAIRMKAGSSSGSCFSAPENLITSLITPPTDTTITLQFDEVAGALEYGVYQGDGLGNFTLYGNITAYPGPIVYELAFLTPNTTYTYAVTAIGTFPQQSELSAPITVTTLLGL
jgi:hypothetical protein